MATSQFLFHAELNDFLPAVQRGLPYVLAYASHQSLKHLVESLGIPHVEIGIVLLNGKQFPTDIRPPDGSRIEVFPAHLMPPGSPRFVLDNHLGRLAVYLRMLGLDTLYRNDYHDQELAQVAYQEERILLTRDRRLLMRKELVFGYCIRHLEPSAQLAEVHAHYHISVPEERAPHSFRRCPYCNTPLQPASKQSIMDRLLPLTKQYYEEFFICPTCNRIYWKGSHIDNVQALLRDLPIEG